MKNRVCVKPLPSHQSDCGHALHGRVSLYPTIRFLFITPIHAILFIFTLEHCNHCRDDFSAFLFFPSELSLSINDMSCVCSVYANKYIIKWEKKLHTADERRRQRRRRHDNGAGELIAHSREPKQKKKTERKELVWRWRTSAEKCLSLDAGKDFFGVAPAELLVDDNV